ncbi:MFS transporter [Nonomuraea sp. B12E4]|uniref:MFS transporter n=1 Tax=Nonomuraea sp. B12E4 TaxID=3153564 RepID=UPI00325CD3FD
MGASGLERRRHALAACLVAAFITGLDVSIVNVALPSIREQLRATEVGLQWMLCGYALSFGLVLVPAGRLGDARSRRALFLAGVALFSLSSAVSGLAWSMSVVVAGRMVQGLAAGLLTPQVSGLIQQLFQGQERGRAFGALGAALGISTTAGPLIGGVLVTVFGPEHGWRWVFLVNVPIGIALLPVAWRVLPAPRPARAAGLGVRRRESMDPVGVGLLGVGVGGLLVPFIHQYQWEGNAEWLLIPVALVVLAVFVGWERTYRLEPLVDLTLFRRPSYNLGTVIALFYFAGFTGIFFTFTLYLQSGLHYSPLMAGLSITPFALGSAGASVAGGRIVARAGPRLVVVGLSIVTVGLVATMAMTELVPGRGVALVTALPLLVAGIGSGLVISSNQVITLSEVPPAGGGSASGVLQTGQRLGTAMGNAAVGSMFFGSLRDGWPTAFRHGLLVVLVCVLIALAVAVYHLIQDLRAQTSGWHRPAR